MAKTAATLSLQKDARTRTLSQRLEFDDAQLELTYGSGGFFQLDSDDIDWLLAHRQVWVPQKD